MNKIVIHENMDEDVEQPYHVTYVRSNGETVAASENLTTEGNSRNNINALTEIILGLDSGDTKIEVVKFGIDYGTKTNEPKKIDVCIKWSAGETKLLPWEKCLFKVIQCKNREEAFSIGQAMCDIFNVAVRISFGDMSGSCRDNGHYLSPNKN